VAGGLFLITIPQNNSEKVEPATKLRKLFDPDALQSLSLDSPLDSHGDRGINSVINLRVVAGLRILSRSTTIHPNNSEKTGPPPNDRYSWIPTHAAFHNREINSIVVDTLREPQRRSGLFSIDGNLSGELEKNKCAMIVAISFEHDAIPAQSCAWRW